MQRFKEEHTIEPKGHGGGQPAMLNEEDLALIKGMVDLQPDLTAKEISNKLRKEVGKRPSGLVIWRALEELGYSRKKAVVLHEARKRPDVALEKTTIGAGPQTA